MDNHPTITAEERRAAWRAFFRKPLAWAEVIIFFIIAAYFVHFLVVSSSWEKWKAHYHEETFWIDITLLVSCCPLFFHIVLDTITLKFGIFHGIIKDTILSKGRHFFNPNKLLQHPLYPTRLRKAVRITRIGFFLSLAYFAFYVIIRSS